MCVCRFIDFVDRSFFLGASTFDVKKPGVSSMLPGVLYGFIFCAVLATLIAIFRLFVQHYLKADGTVEIESEARIKNGATIHSWLLTDMLGQAGIPALVTIIMLTV